MQLMQSVELHSQGLGEVLENLLLLFSVKKIWKKYLKSLNLVKRWTKLSSWLMSDTLDIDVQRNNVKYYQLPNIIEDGQLWKIYR